MEDFSHIGQVRMIENTKHRRVGVGGVWHMIFMQNNGHLLVLKRLIRFFLLSFFGFYFYYYCLVVMFHLTSGFFVCLSVSFIRFRLWRWMTKSAKNGGNFGIGNSLSGKGS